MNVSFVEIRKTETQNSVLLVADRTHCGVILMCIYLSAHCLRKSEASLHMSPRMPLTLWGTPTIQRKWRGDSEDSFLKLWGKSRNMHEVAEEQESRAQRVRGAAAGRLEKEQDPWGSLVYKNSCRHRNCTHICYTM